MTIFMDEGLQGVTLDNHRRDSVQSKVHVFDIMHPEHGKIGTLHGSVHNMGATQEYDPEGGWKIGKPKGGKRTFHVGNVGIDSEALEKIHGRKMERGEYNKLASQTLGAGTVRDLGKQLKKHLRVTQVFTSSRITGSRLASARKAAIKKGEDPKGVQPDFKQQSISPMRIRDSIDIPALVDALIEGDTKIKRLKISRIKMDPGNWKMAQDSVSDGGRAATEGPVKVYRREGSRRFEMGDGHHRAAHALANGETHIDATIAPETLPRLKKRTSEDVVDLSDVKPQVASLRKSIKAAPNTNAPSSMTYPGKKKERHASGQLQKILRKTGAPVGRQSDTKAASPNLTKRNAPGTSSNSTVDKVKMAAHGLKKG